MLFDRMSRFTRKAQCQIINISQISSENTSLEITLSIVGVVICMQLDPKEMKMYNDNSRTLQSSFFSFSLPLIRLVLFDFCICYLCWTTERLNIVQQWSLYHKYTHQQWIKPIAILLLPIGISALVNKQNLPSVSSFGTFIKFIL